MVDAKRNKNRRFQGPHPHRMHLEESSLHHVAQLAQVLGSHHGHRTLFFVLCPSDLLNLKTMPNRGSTIWRRSGRCLFMKKDSQWSGGPRRASPRVTSFSRKLLRSNLKPAAVTPAMLHELRPRGICTRRKVHKSRGQPSSQGWRPTKS